jgi:hypothetical protein
LRSGRHPPFNATDQRGIIFRLRLCETHGEPKVGERNGANITSKNLSQRASSFRGNIDRNQTGLVKVYNKPTREGNYVNGILEKR